MFRIRDSGLKVHGSRLRVRGSEKKRLTYLKLKAMVVSKTSLSTNWIFDLWEASSLDRHPPSAKKAVPRIAFACGSGNLPRSTKMLENRGKMPLPQRKAH
jgi:hypothetical protein